MIQKKLFIGGAGIIAGVFDVIYKSGIAVFKIALEVMDFGAWERRLTGKPVFDVVFVSNYRDEQDVKAFGHKGKTLPDVMSWIRICLGDSRGLLRMIGSLTGDLVHRDGIKKGRDQFIAAIDGPIKGGARLVLFGATTKRLFGKGCERLKEIYPDVVFSNGDNNTEITLQDETMRIMGLTGMIDANPHILIIGPSGFLGSGMIPFLRDKGFDVKCIGTDAERAAKAAEEYLVPVYTSFDEVGPVDLVVACNPAEPVRLTPERMDKIRNPERMLVVVDVCEPYNLSKAACSAYHNKVLRFDANSYSPDLHYVLGNISGGILRLGKDILWGCFMEALILSVALRSNNQSVRDEVMKGDWMNVTPENQKRLRWMIGQLGIRVGLPPIPVNFGKPVKEIPRIFGVSRQISDFSASDMPRKNSLSAHVPLLNSIV